MGRTPNTRTTADMLMLLDLVASLPAGRMRADYLARRLGWTVDRLWDTLERIDMATAEVESLLGTAIAYDAESQTVSTGNMPGSLSGTLRLTPGEARGLMNALTSCGEDLADRLADRLRGAFAGPAAAGVGGQAGSGQAGSGQAVKSALRAATEAASSPLLGTALRGIAESVVLEGSYRGPDDDRPHRCLAEPDDIFYDNDENAWYLHAWRRAGDQKPAGWRVFKLSRFQTLEATAEPFDPAGHCDADEPAGDGRLGDIDGARKTVLVVHDPDAVRSLPEWRGVERVTRPRKSDAGRLTPDDLARGGYIARIPWLPQSTWLPAAIAGTFGAVEAVDDDLRSAVRDAARRVREALREAGAKSGD